MCCLPPLRAVPASCAQVVKTWAAKKGDKGARKEPLGQRLRATFSTRMLMAWLAWALLLWCARRLPAGSSRQCPLLLCCCTRLRWVSVRAAAR